MYARVVVDTGATSSIDFLTYEIPDGLDGRIGLGNCVLVPIATRQAVGYVIGLEKASSIEKTRPIIAEVESPLRLTDNMLRFARWIAARYLCPLQRVIAAMLPGAMQFRVQELLARGDSMPRTEHLTPTESALLRQIASSSGEISPDLLAAEVSQATVRKTIRRLEDLGLIKRRWKLIPPGGKPRVMRGVKLADGLAVDAAVLSNLPGKQAQAMRVIAGLAHSPSLLELVRKHGLSSSAISQLRKKELLADVDVTVRRNPDFASIPDAQVQLNESQKRAVGKICAALDSNSQQSFLIHGVTASGKTEVYLRCIEHALSLGKSGIVLLPEIAITTQVMSIFRSRFGDNAAVLHSALSDGERCDEWIRAARGEARVVVGARSALFAPVANLGLIVVDEEHEPSYKQDTPPRYHAREAALELARQTGAVIVMGSATPSVESYHRAGNGEFCLLEMPERVENRALPTIHVADLREEYAQGHATIFSKKLEESIRDRLSRGEQVILLQNRRAYSTVLLCRDCGYVARCPNCAVTLRFHSAARVLKCHHCAHERPAPTVCPRCESLRIKTFGIGTQRVEEETKKVFPDARILRMDRDTTSRKGSHAAILTAFRKGEADILVGTQMIAKGLDFPHVTLVGVISADTSLHFPDFTASERTFQLISQVSGRSGRGERPGEVVIQTFDPDQYAINCAVNHDYAGFFEQEIEERRAAGYPPFSVLIRIVSRDKDEREAESRLLRLADEIRHTPMAMRKGIRLDGPLPAVLSRLRGEYRWHLVVRGKDRNAVLALLRTVFERNPSLRRQLVVDVDPVSML